MSIINQKINSEHKEISKFQNDFPGVNIIDSDTDDKEINYFNQKKNIENIKTDTLNIKTDIDKIREEIDNFKKELIDETILTVDNKLDTLEKKVNEYIQILQKYNTPINQIGEAQYKQLNLEITNINNLISEIKSVIEDIKKHNYPEPVEKQEQKEFDIKNERKINYILSKNAIVLAFDEVIGKETTFEGNTLNNSINETLKVMELIIENECFTEVINKDLCENMKQIVSQTKQVGVSDDNKYILGGWKGHAIFMFYEKNEDNDTYDFGVINAGEGCDIQGIDGDLTKGIIIFKNIELENINNFFKKYQLYYDSTIRKKEISKKFFPISFYILLLSELLPNSFHIMPPDVEYQINFNSFERHEKILRLKINSQIIGSCCFTNHINYMCYILYKNGISNYNEEFIKWYKNCKLLMKKQIYNEIINKDYDKKYYNWYRYLQDTLLDGLNEVKYVPNKKFTEELDAKENGKEKYGMTYFSTKLGNSKFLSKDSLFNNNYLQNDEEQKDSKKMIKNIYEFKYNEITYDVLKKYSLLKFLINENAGIKDIYDINIFIHLYNLKHLYDIDENTRRDWDYILKENLNSHIIISEFSKYYEIKILILILSCILYFYKGQKYYEYSNKNIVDLSIRFYDKNILKNLYINNGNCVDTLKKIIEEIKCNINYFPNSNNIVKYMNDKIEEDELDKNRLFDKLYKKKEKQLKLTRNNFILNTILHENEMYDIDWSMYKNKNQILEFLNDIQGNKENSKTINIASYDDKVSTNYVYKNKIILFKEKIKEKLLCDSVNIKYYIIYFYLCELNKSSIEEELFNKYNDIALKYFEYIYEINTINKFNSIVETYIIRYDQKINIKKLSTTIDAYTLIPDCEMKNYSLVDKYIFIIVSSEGKLFSYCETDVSINFYICNLDKEKKIILIKNNQNTETSIRKLGELLNSKYKSKTFRFDRMMGIGTDNIA